MERPGRRDRHRALRRSAAEPARRRREHALRSAVAGDARHAHPELRGTRLHGLSRRRSVHLSAVQRITTAARSSSAPTDTSTSPWAMAARGATQATRRSGRGHCSGRSCASTSSVPGHATPADTASLPTTRSSAPTRSGALDEIWAFGVRNPWRITFDDPVHGGTGALTIGDVGQGAWEEINYEPSRRGGRNYGWRIREGAARLQHRRPPRPFCRFASRFTSTATRSARTTAPRSPAGTSIAAAVLGAFYQGRYFYADYISGRDVLDRARHRSGDARGARLPASSSTPPKSPRPATSARSTSTSSARSTSSSTGRDPAPGADQWRRRQRRSPRCVGSDASG